MTARARPELGFQTHFQNEISEENLSTRHHKSQSSITPKPCHQSFSLLSPNHGSTISPKLARRNHSLNYKSSQLRFTPRLFIHLPRALCQSRCPSSTIHSTDTLWWWRNQTIHHGWSARDRELGRVWRSTGRPTRNLSSRTDRPSRMSRLPMHPPSYQVYQPAEELRFLYQWTREIWRWYLQHQTGTVLYTMWY